MLSCKYNIWERKLIFDLKTNHGMSETDVEAGVNEKEKVVNDVSDDLVQGF